MVGTTRFELATSPTPRVRSTRLSHVPTLLPAVQEDSRGYLIKCTRAELLGSDVLLGKLSTLPEEELVHLLYQELLGLASPGL